MNKESKKLINNYLKDVSKAIVCKFTVKRLFIKDLKNQIYDLYYENNKIDLAMIYDRYGTPSEIKNGFGDLETEKYIKQAKLFKIGIISTICLIIILIVILVTILNGYGSTITVNKI